MKKREIKKRKNQKNTRYQEDEKYRKRLKKLSRERYHKDRKYKSSTLERSKKRYHEDKKYREATIQRAKERYQRLKIELQLVKYFRRNGYLRFPDEKLRKKMGENYKKGYEVRLAANDKKELSEIKNLLRKAGFKYGKPFQKSNRLIQPIYGKDAVEKFQSILAR